MYGINVWNQSLEPMCGTNLGKQYMETYENNIWKPKKTIYGNLRKQYMDPIWKQSMEVVTINVL